MSDDELDGPRPIEINYVNRNSNLILGKDWVMKWYLCNPSKAFRRPPHSILRSICTELHEW